MIRMWSGMIGMSNMVVIVMWDRDGRWWVSGGGSGKPVTGWGGWCVSCIGKEEQG